MKTLENRLAPSDLTPGQLRELGQVGEVVTGSERLALVGRKGRRVELPEPIRELLASVLRSMREGKAIVLLPENGSLTTQAAGEFLGVSRPFVVELLKKGEIPHHKVGTHRRIYLKDLLKYQCKRDKTRRATLDELRSQVIEAGLYEKGAGRE